MRDAGVFFDIVDRADERFDRPIEWLLIGLLAFSALAFGAVQAWSELIFCLTAFAIGLIFATKLLIRPDVALVRSWTYVPAGAFLVLVALQLVPLPAGLIRTISPATYELKYRLLSDLPGAAERLRWMSLTFDREATMHDLRLLTGVVVVYVVVLNTIRRASQVRRLLGAIAVIGAAMAVVALAQDVAGTNRILFWIPMPDGRPARSGTFVHRSHFGQFTNLCIGASVGLLLVLVNQHFRRDNYTAAEVSAKLRLETFRPVYLLIGAIVLGLAAMVLSLSRGAMLSGAIAGVCTALMVVTRVGPQGARMYGRGWVLTALVVCAGAIVLLDTNAVIERLNPRTAQELHGNRLLILRDLRQAWIQFPVLGTGLGSHGVVFPMFDRSEYPYFASHAENEYAQVLMETGGAGLALALIFIAMIWIAYVRTVRGPTSPASSAMLGLGYGWMAVLLHSLTDFGQHIPAVAGLTAVTSALMVNLFALRQRELDRPSEAPAGRAVLGGRIGALVAMLALAAAVIHDATLAWRGESAWNRAQVLEAALARRGWEAGNAQFADLIEAASEASEARPGNARYRYLLNYYRWKAISRLRDETTGSTVMPAELLNHARRIVGELHAGRWVAPTFAPPYLLAGQIERFVIDGMSEAGTQHIRAGAELAGADPAAALLLGQVEALEGRADDAVAQLQRAVRMAPDYRAVAVDLCLKQLGRADLALTLAGDDVATLDHLAGELAARAATQPLAVQAAERAFQSLKTQSARPDCAPEVLVQFADKLVAADDLVAAVELYERALLRNFGQLDWRVKLARLYMRLGRYADAQREIDHCLRRRPSMPEAQAMEAELKRTTIPAR